MPSLINIANQLKVTSAFANLHDTFSREITVYKNSKQVTIASSAQYNSIYGNAGAYSNTQNQIVSSTFMARIYYIKMDEEFLSDSASNKGSQNKIILPQGSVKIVVDPAGYLFIKEARKVSKSELNTQRSYLGKFKEGHGFSSAPGKKEKIGFELKNSTLDIDHNHGYNTTLNEEELLKKK
jgi:hypothetical protein